MKITDHLTAEAVSESEISGPRVRIAAAEGQRGTNGASAEVRRSPGQGPTRLRRMVPTRRRVINSPLLLRSGLLALLLLVLVNVWHSFVVYRNAAALVDRADEQEKAGDWTAAAASLQRYLGLRPADASARSRLAQAFDRIAVNSADKYRALELFASAVAAQPHELGPRRRHLELTYELGDYSSALQRAEQLLQIEPDDALGLKYLALALYAGWEQKEVSLLKVQQAFEAARKANSSDAALAARLARIYRLEADSAAAAKKSQLADEILDRLVESSGDKVAALAARYEYRREFDLPGADADLDHALRLVEEPERINSSADRSIFLSAGLRAREHNEVEIAADYFRRAIVAAPEQLPAYLLLSQLQRRAGEPKAAVRVLEEGLEHVGAHSLQLQSQLASLRIELGELAEAETLLRVMQSEAALLFGEEQTSWLATISSLRAELSIARDDFVAAVPELKRALLLREGGAAYGQKAAADARLHERLGGCYASLDQWDLAALAYQAAADLLPQRPDLALAAAEAFERVGWLDEAVRRYEEALTLQEAPVKAWESLVDARYRQQMRLPASKRDWKSWREAFVSAKRALPESALLKLLQAEYELAGGRLDQAAETLTVLDATKLEPRLAIRLAQALERAGRNQEADAVCERVSGESPLQGALLRCDLLLGRDPRADVEETSTAVVERLTPADRHVLDVRLALVKLQRGHREEAAKQLALLAERTPGDLRPVQLLAELALDREDWPEAGRRATQLQKLEKAPGESGYQFYQAQRWIGEALKSTSEPDRESRLAEARGLEAELVRLRPFWTCTYLLKARLAELALHPDHEAAIVAYYEALRLGERRIGVYQELVSLLLRQQRLSEAAVLIDRLREDDDVPDELTKLAVAIDVGQGKVERAIRTAASEARRDPENVTNHLRLGELLSLNPPSEPAARQQRLDEAESEFNQARARAPHDPRVWTALMAFYHAAGRQVQAQETLACIEKVESLSDADKQWLLAQGYALVGDHEQAKRFHQAAVEANPDRLAVLLQAGDYFFARDPSRAERYFRRALAIEPNEAGASRKLAALVALRSTSDQDMEEVSRILDGDTEPDLRKPSDVADERLRAVLLLRRGGLSFRNRAQKLLESLVAEGSDQPLDHLLLARLYENQGQIDKARDQLEMLLRQPMPDAAHLATFADYCLRTTDDKPVSTPQLAEVLDQLSAIEPESRFFRTLDLRTHWLKLAGRLNEVPELVETFLNQPTAAPDTAQRTLRLLRVAELYETLGYASKAEHYYRQAKELSPRTYRPLAIWLARHERPAEAIALCREAAIDDDSAIPATVLAVALTAGWTTMSERSTAEELFAEALVRHPDDRGLLFALSTLRLKQHDDKDAERLLRRFLRLDSRNAVAMNNLAMLLAARSGGAEEALELIDRAIAIAGAKAELVDTKGWVLFEQKRYGEAETSFQEALALAPQKARYRFHLALSYEHQGKPIDSLAIDRSLADRLTKETLQPKEREELRKLAIRL